jgi:hypothetical protein
MVYSYYILKYPYTLIFKLLSLLKLNNYNGAYCADLLDYQVMQPVLKLLPELKIIAKNRKTRKELAALGVKAKILPAFPQGVLMCRLAAHKFPAAGIRKIGMRHGPFHFKALPGKSSFQLFDKFIFTSEMEVEIAKEKGITNGIGLGYPKLDAALSGKMTSTYLLQLARGANLDTNKKTLLFTATWEASGMSALSRWKDRIIELTSDFNILVTLHPWIDDSIKIKLAKTPGVHLVQGYDTTPYILLADVCIGDTSSILAECCALNKPIITFSTQPAPRTVPYVMQMIKNFSLQITEFEELLPAIGTYLAQQDFKKAARSEASRIMFSNLDGSAGKKIAAFVKEAFNPYCAVDVCE